MKLSIKERIFLYRFVQNQRANYLTLKELAAVKEKVTFTEKENREYDIKTENVAGNMQITFNLEAADAGIKDIDFPPLARAHIVGQLKGLDKVGELEEALISLYEKFVLGKKDDADKQSKGNVKDNVERKQQRSSC